jgi:hypothetical protein
LSALWSCTTSPGPTLAICRSQPSGASAGQPCSAQKFTIYGVYA